MFIIAESFSTTYHGQHCRLKLRGPAYYYNAFDFMLFIETLHNVFTNNFGKIFGNIFQGLTILLQIVEEVGSRIQEGDF
jgi:hypothetical protein